jgi:ribonuclease HII
MYTVGIDEVGRGCWAGPLVAGAVVLGRPIDGLKDSKKLSRKRREELTLLIEKEALAYGLGWVWPEELDSIGITTAVKRAMERALAAVEISLAKSGKTASEVIIDGNFNYLPEVAGARAVVRADDTVPAASAASIIAKVARDTYMATTAHTAFPEYGFDMHVGYGTAAHSKALALHGVTEIHRKSYKPIRLIIEKNQPASPHVGP